MKVSLKVLQSRKEALAGREFVFDRCDTFLCGRGPAAHCRIADDPSLSRHHFMLEVNPSYVRLMDLGSRNGTYVGGIKYGGRPIEDGAPAAAKNLAGVEIKDRDVILAGGTQFQVHIDIEEAKVKGDGAPRSKSSENRPEIADYEILRSLGKGGMGEVFEARQISTNGKYAIKIMLPDFAVQENFKEMFFREMRTCWAVEHTNLARFHQSGFSAEAQSFYIIVDLASGGNLHDLVRKRGGRVSILEGGPLIAQALDGLAFLHEWGFVHRDIKPPNILLDGEDGAFRIKVCDFGLAKNFERAGLTRLGLTNPGDIRGTYPFMPREQVTDAKMAKPVSDVFSIGATAYYIFTGYFPYDFGDADPLCAILEGKTVPVRKRMPEMPPAFADVLDKALAVDARDRYQTAGEMRRAWPDATAVCRAS